MGREAGRVGDTVPEPPPMGRQSAFSPKMLYFLLDDGPIHRLNQTRLETTGIALEGVPVVPEQPRPTLHRCHG